MITAICISSRYPEEVPVLDMKSETVVESLTLVFNWLSSSQKLHTDLVTSFTINLTTAFFRKFSLKIIHSSSQHPESNLIECCHQSVKTTVKVLCTKNGTDWKANLPYMLLALRTITYESTDMDLTEHDTKLIDEKSVRMLNETV